MLKEIKKIDKPWIAIIDHSINIGTKKLFVVLRIELDVLCKKDKAVTLEDCECVGLKICEVVNGESVKKDLEEIFKISGNPNAIIKDTDYTLNKGVKLYNKSRKKPILLIEDISHVVAKSLKKEFEETKSYKQFTQLIKNGSARIRNTEIAFLTPPKLRNKARFQNVSRLGKWGEKMMKHFNIRGRAKKGSILERLRLAFPGFSRLKPFILNFSKTTAVTSKIMQRLKNKGLEKSTYDECKIMLKELPKSSRTAKSLRDWLDRHLKIQKQLGSYPMPISSDIIESLFGKFKHTIEKSPQSDMNHSILIIPLLCGKISEEKISDALNSVSQKELNEWKEKHIGKTMRMKRIDFLNQNIQKVGNS
ncbi:hypothetical protein [Thermococcus sp.]|uniref:hypothetical protein n=1 Tax=Thermococcus sp. TaxID=35749 RepID=UPI00260EEE68|nr:hypothetical protein [Thermococcus sp.]